MKSKLGVNGALKLRPYKNKGQGKEFGMDDGVENGNGNGAGHQPLESTGSSDFTKSGAVPRNNNDYGIWKGNEDSAGKNSRITPIGNGVEDGEGGGWTGFQVHDCDTTIDRWPSDEKADKYPLNPQPQSHPQPQPQPRHQLHSLSQSYPQPLTHGLLPPAHSPDQDRSLSPTGREHKNG